MRGNAEKRVAADWHGGERTEKSSLRSLYLMYLQLRV